MFTLTSADLSFESPSFI
jgi:hypothetical protein